MRKSSNLFWSLSSNYVRMGFDFALVMVSIPLLLHHLGSSNYGRWVVLASIYQLLHILDFGLQQHLFKVAASEKEPPVERIRAIFSLQLLLSFVFGVPALLILLWHGGVLGWMALSAIVLLPLRLYQSLLNGKHRIALTNMSYLVGRAFFGVGLLVLVLTHHMTLSRLCFLFLLTQAIEAISYMALARKSLSSWCPCWGPVLWKQLKVEAKLAQPFLWINVSSQLFTRMEPILLSTLFGYHIVAMYDVAWKLAFYFFTFCRQIIHAYSPTLASKKEERLAALSRTLKACGSVALPLFLFACWHRQILFEAWLGSVSSLSLQVFLPLLSVMLITLFQCVLSTTLSLQKFEHKVAIYMILSTLFRLTLSVSAGVMLGWRGYVYGMFIAVVISDLLLWLPYAARCLETHSSRLLQQFAWQSILPLFGIVLMGCLITPDATPRAVVVLRTISEIGTYIVMYAFFHKFQKHLFASSTT